MVGGFLSTNAGGSNVLRYGNTRELVLGLEVVLPDGQVWNGLRGLHEVGRMDGRRFERWLDPIRYGLRSETDTPGRTGTTSRIEAMYSRAPLICSESAGSRWSGPELREIVIGVSKPRLLSG